QLGTSYALIMSPGDSHRMTLRMHGTSISLLVDGIVRVGPITDASISAAGYAGIYGGAAVTDTTGTHLDNFNAQSSDPPVATPLPDRASGPQRAANSAYAILIPSPVDQGTAGGGTWPESDAFSGTDGTDLAAHTPNTGGTWVLDADLNGDAVLTG